MTSRDTLNWTRYEGSLSLSGPENPKTGSTADYIWRTGLSRRGYLSGFTINTACIVSTIVSLKVRRILTLHHPSDGFVSKHAGAREERVVTNLYLQRQGNVFKFRHIRKRFRLYCHANLTSEFLRNLQLFGDSCNRRVTFTKFNGSVGLPPGRIQRTGGKFVCGYGRKAGLP